MKLSNAHVTMTVPKAPVTQTGLLATGLLFFVDRLLTHCDLRIYFAPDRKVKKLSSSFVTALPAAAREYY